MFTSRDTCYKTSGDLTDKNNYRPIALSSIASKVFENIIILRIEEYLWTNDHQFGLKSGHSTDLSIYALSEFIEYFKAVLFLYMLHSLMPVRLSIKSVIGLFFEN